MQYENHLLIPKGSCIIYFCAAGRVVSIHQFHHRLILIVSPADWWRVRLQLVDAEMALVSHTGVLLSSSVLLTFFHNGKEGCQCPTEKGGRQLSENMLLNFRTLLAAPGIYKKPGAEKRENDSPCEIEVLLRNYAERTVVRAGMAAPMFHDAADYCSTSIVIDSTSSGAYTEAQAKPEY